MVVSFLCLAAAILLGIGGQIALKLAAGGAVTIIAYIINPLTIVGFVIYILADLSDIVALKKIPVSIAFPSVPASYALVAVLVHLLWNEPPGLPQIYRSRTDRQPGGAYSSALSRRAILPL
jgi:small multidrug resistance pump